MFAWPCVRRLLVVLLAPVAVFAVARADTGPGIRRTASQHALRAARTGHTATRLTNGTVLIAGGRNEGAALAAAEIYIPPLPYTATLFAIPVGGYDRNGSYDTNGNVFVADDGGQPRIVKFDRRGRFIAAVGGRGSRAGRLNAPHSVATNASGNVCVADGGNSRVQVFTHAVALSDAQRQVITFNEK